MVFIDPVDIRWKRCKIPIAKTLLEPRTSKREQYKVDTYENLLHVLILREYLVFFHHFEVMIHHLQSSVRIETGF